VNRIQATAAGRGIGIAVVGCALALTLIGVAKPLVIDDAAYYQYARHIAQDPGDPYGFEVFWYEAPQPANEVLAPAGFLYWWAAGMWLFGDEPTLWKLWLFPIALLLTGALGVLLRRVAPGVATPMLCAIVLSPAVLPALNLMLDLPALALSATSLALMLRACDEDRLGLAIAAGLLAGIALETKYTALLPLIASLGYAWLTRRILLAAVVGSLASAVFLGWELWTAHLYGASHFAGGLRQVGKLTAAWRVHWGGALVGLVGSSSAGTALLALVALGVSRSRIVALALLATAGFAGISALPAAPIAAGQALFHGWQAEMWIFAPLGLFVVGSLAALARHEGLRLRAPPPRSADAALDRFVLVWLAIEVAGFFLVSPYPALRRVIGVQVAACFVVGRAAARAPAGAEAGRALRPFVAWGAALALLFAVSDVSDARARVEVLQRAIDRLDAEPSLSADGTRWYVGHWGFQFYAERHGLRPVIPGVSRLEPGDAFVGPIGVYKQRPRVPRTSLEAIDNLTGSNPWPWSTLPWAYASYPPLRRQPNVQLALRLARVIESTTAR
jgi:hypothetical protein